MEPPPTYQGQVNQFGQLPNTIGDEPLPPSYEQIFGPTSKKEAISTGPTEYIVRDEFTSSIFLLFLIHLIMKMALGISTMTKGFFFAIFGVVYWISFTNVWIFCLTVYHHHQTLVRYKIDRLVYAPCFWFFLLDFVIYLGIPALGFWFGYDVNFQITAGIVMSLVNMLAFLIIINEETMDYKPFADSEKLIPVSTYEESTSDNQLSVSEWGSFKIVIANTGNKPVVGTIIIVRTVYSERIDRRNQVQWDKEDVKLRLFLNRKFEPGTEITLVPETHTLAGAFRIKEFRAFGKDRGVSVEVAIYASEEKNAPYMVKRIQKFSKKI